MKTEDQVHAPKPWWTRRPLPDLGKGFFFEIIYAFNVFLEDAINGGGRVFQKSTDGIFIGTVEDFENKLSFINFRLIRTTEEQTKTYSFVSENGLLVLDYSGTTTASARFVCNDLQTYEVVSKIISEFITLDAHTTGPVFTIVKNGDELSVSRIGVAGHALERSNYADTVLEAYDHVVEDLKNANPCGRLIILNGEPGTGKTYIVRSFLREVPNSTFVLIPPHMVSELGGPNLIPVFTNLKNIASGPIILVIEDADMCLIQRGADNMGTIASLLNLGDGILGSILDIRIIATTNGRKIDLDKAVTRPGRLCRQFEIKSLDPAHACKVFARLTGKEATPNLFSTKVSLAEVYRVAMNNGWKSEPVINTVGFSNCPKAPDYY